MRKNLGSAFVLGVALLVLGCHKIQKQTSASKVIAKVAGDPIYLDEFEQNYGLLKQTMGNSDPDVMKGLKYRALNELIISKVLKKEANKRGLAVAAEEIDEKFAQWKETLSQEKLNRLFNRYGKSESLIKKRIEYQLLINRLMTESFRENTRVSDDEINNYLKSLKRGKASENSGQSRAKSLAYLRHIKEVKFYKDWVTKLLRESEVLRNDELYAQTF